MKLYKKNSNNSTTSTKNTLISFTLKGDGEELFEYDLPYPISYTRQSKDIYRVSFAINGTFTTIKGIRYLNDILARFTLSFEVIHTYKSLTNDEGVELSEFRGLKSIQRAKSYESVDIGQDNVFWSIKLYTEALIKESSGLVAYSLIESFALDRFIDRAKDKATLKAKCRSIWNWYDEREWTIPSRKGLGMSRQEGAKKAHQKKAADTKAKVIGAIEALNFLQEKINIATVSRQAQVSRDTAKKYLVELGLKKKK